MLSQLDAIKAELNAKVLGAVSKPSSKDDRVLTKSYASGTFCENVTCINWQKDPKN